MFIQQTVQNNTLITNMFKKLKTEVINYFYRKSRLWGVVWETNKPPEFIVTAHAEERLMERLFVDKKEAGRLLIAAWFSRQEVPSHFIKRKEEISRERNLGTIHYRRFDGMIWVFGKSYLPRYSQTQHTLITIYPED